MSLASSCSLIAALLVVGVAAGDLAERGVALYAHEGVKSLRRGVGRSGRVAVNLSFGRNAEAARVGRIHVEHGAVGVTHSPHEYHAYHDGIAHLVVDLDGRNVHVADAQRYFLARHEGVDPKIARAAESAAVLAEEYHHARLVGLLHVEAVEHHHDGDKTDRCGGDGQPEQIVGQHGEEEENDGRNQQKGDGEHDEAVQDLTGIREFFAIS